MRDAGLVIGVDIGTTGVKAVALDATAASHGAAGRDHPTEAAVPGWSTQDPDVGASAAGL
jgi:sugar (pentulose or hexulose) kinase